MSHKGGKRGQGQAPGDEVGQKFHCDNCQANVTDGVRISCNECPEFDLCTTCFSRGIELGSHKNDHSYRVVTRHRFPIFTEDWSADEELLLIDGLRQFGMGNWKDAAEHVGTKTKEECEQHYLSVYVGADSWPLPDMNRQFDVKFARLPDDKKGRASTSNKTKLLSSQPSNHEIVGYMPGRLEFETEYENEAEQVIKDMCFNDDDPPEEIELRKIVLKIYNNKLDRRLYRKGFIFERGLLEYRKNQAIEKKRPKEERDLLNKIKVFSRMQTGEDFEEFSTGLLNEQALRQRIAQLQEWRRNGIMTLEDGAHYEVERAQRPSRRATTQRDSAHLLERLQKIAASSAIRDPVSGSTSALAAQKQQSRHPNNFLDVESADGAELLSKSERELCLQLRIFPQTYLTTKETLLSEYARIGHLRRRRACDLAKIDANKTKELYDFFVASGWIKSNFRNEVDLATATTGASDSINRTPAMFPSAHPVATTNSNSSQLVKKEY
ncbi:transcriptional adaptor 2 [Coemansia reversa NRRL 1564]|uniref:Transcriptional adapter 2 n=1 Tax=Coemansia reversa (strain ATCC 12441 / NRRL 1564) TaxID=763665 RepID=A0A2G5BFS6_COERN|nr:transcriptional adaptor 2 [Coemansia reversa NRRL 1564]|eukprot:PIA17864.1 transcriptional adaptor 2 [Coemansia reversa NRRL 1564]